MVVAQFQLRRIGTQNNNRFAYAQLATANGVFLNTGIVATNAISYNANYNMGGSDNLFTIIGYDYASNTATRTYYIQVKRGHVNDNLEIKNAAIWAIEFTP